MGARLPRADRRAAHAARRRRTPRRSRTTSIRAFRDEVVAAIGAQNLVDVRSPDEYAGRLLAPAHLPQEQAQRAGHIPTAANVPWSKAANDDGTFRSDDELHELYTEAGVDWDKDTIAYCRIGERSSHTWFVLKELLGQHEREELRRLVDRVRLAGRRPGRAGRRAGRGLMCGATEGGLSLDGVERRQGGDHPGPGGPRRRAGAATPTCGCSTGPVSSPPRCPTSATGHFRFFAGDGEWTLRTLAAQGRPGRHPGARRGRLRQGTGVAGHWHAESVKVRGQTYTRLAGPVGCPLAQEEKSTTWNWPTTGGSSERIGSGSC